MARTALAHAAWFAPHELIPRWLLARCLKLDLETGDDAYLFTDAMQRLSNLGLIDSRSGDPVLHRLVAAFAQQGQTGIEQRVVEHTIAREVTAQCHTGLPAGLLIWQTHLWHIAEHSAERYEDSSGRLLNSLGYHLQLIADYTGAEDTYERALSINEAALGPNHPIVALRIKNLGTVLRDQGNLDGGCHGRLPACPIHR